MRYRNIPWPELQPEQPVPQTLPEPRLFETLQDALLYFRSTLDDSTVKPLRPWIHPADAVRRVNFLAQQFQKDWPDLRGLFSPEESHRLIEAYRNLPALTQLWQYLDGLSFGDEEDSESSGVLGKSRQLRDDLLALAQVAYRDKPHLLAEIERIRAMSKPNNSMYDELTADLASTVTLFQENKFENHAYVTYPADLLAEATRWANQLPLFRPKTKTSSTDKSTSAPLISYAFSLFSNCFYHLTACGRFLHFADRQAGALYPLLSTTARRKPKAKPSAGTSTPTGTDASTPVNASSTASAGTTTPAPAGATTPAPAGTTTPAGVSLAPAGASTPADTSVVPVGTSIAPANTVTVPTKTS